MISKALLTIHSRYSFISIARSRLISNFSIIISYGAFYYFENVISWGKPWCPTIACKTLSSFWKAGFVLKTLIIALSDLFVLLHTGYTYD